MTRNMGAQHGPDGFELRQIVGRSAACVVWEAAQTSTGRVVALKILNADLADEDASRRFNRECRVMGMLSGHPHIVTIYDAGIDTGRPWLAMQYCPHGSYAGRIKKSGPLPIAEAVDVLIKIGGALAVAHERGVLHCDVKPANIMITEFGEPALGDFGIARVTVGAATRTAAIGYSLDHAPPELLNNERPSVSADVYSLGTTIWELLCGHPPFRQRIDTPTVSVMRRILLEPLPSPTAPDVTAELATLLARMGAKDPRDRPANMGEVVTMARSLRFHPESNRSHPAPDGPARRRSPADTGPPRQQADTRSHRAQPVAESATTGTSTSQQPTEHAAEDNLAHTQVRTGSRKITNLFSDSRDSPHPTPKRSRLLPIVAAAVALVVILLISATILLLANRETRQEIALQAVDAAARDPFTPNFSVGQEFLPDTALAATKPDGLSTMRSVPGNTEGLYQATRGGQNCERDEMLVYLTERPSLSAAWVDALNTDPKLGWPGGSRLYIGSLRQYFAQLTPVLLRADTQVTEHAYHDGSTEQFQSILQAGTAVLVDGYGVPRARCSGGNPLTQMRTGSSEPEYSGQRWPGFTSAALASVIPASEEIHQFGLVDVGLNTPFRRPAGSTGEDDVEQIPEQADIEGIYKISGNRTSCTGPDCGKPTTVSLSWRIIDCAADTCGFRSLDGKWGGSVDLTRDGTTWRAAGTMSQISSHTCGQNPVKTDFSISVSVATAEVIDGDWLVKTLDGTYETSAPAGQCAASSASYNVSGSRS